MQNNTSCSITIQINIAASFGLLVTVLEKHPQQSHCRFSVSVLYPPIPSLCCVADKLRLHFCRFHDFHSSGLLTLYDQTSLPGGKMLSFILYTEITWVFDRHRNEIESNEPMARPVRKPTHFYWKTYTCTCISLNKGSAFHGANERFD